ncbi:ATP synthase F0 subunit 8 [Fusobacterium necrophorum subsp. funduliforme]|uniref:Uncharacterized protein n=1 Tax=Fusobacterium necrophorum subsp. funduliforme Fnf 1007 TaxID=1161424 RepID=A0AAN3VTX7_9FUSO|nr:hypothetical protein HMPREF1127_1793 [Fusobacterium necrophorum subsp. funduliforme Fnf 1007]
MQFYLLILLTVIIVTFFTNFLFFFLMTFFINQRVKEITNNAIKSYQENLLDFQNK